MARILLRSGKEPWVPLEPETVLDLNVLGTNSGNMLFSTAVFAALDVGGQELNSDYFQVERTGRIEDVAALIEERHDRLVVPMANAFRPTFTTYLDRWSELLERVDMPASIIGIGGQFELPSNYEEVSDEVEDAARRFVRAALERGPSIGVRGETSAGFLRHLGFPDDVIDVIGCPSLYRPDLDVALSPAPSALPDDARIALSLTPRFTGERGEALGAFVRENVERFEKLVYFPQENKDLSFMLWGTPFTDEADRDLPRHAGHRLFVEDRARFFVDERTWRTEVSRFDFAVGNRIHGAIASVLAGVPVVVITFESRLSELADYHALPQVPLSELPDHPRLESLLDLVDPDAFRVRHEDNLSRYVAFLERHGLEHSFGRTEASRFTRRMADVVLPEPVVVAPARVDEQALARLRWLRDRSAPGLPKDIRRQVPTWADRRLSDGPAREAGWRIRRLERRAKSAEARLKAAEERLKATDAALAAQPERGPARRLVSRVARRLRRSKG